MKKSLVIIGLVIACLTFNSFAYAGWHDLTQSQRNQAILDRAEEDDGTYVGENCKNWVRTVVLDASDNAVSIPSTIDNYYWNYHQYVYSYSAMIEYAEPGDIVQMELSFNNGPHTAIIWEITATGVIFIESNWCDPATCLTVDIRDEITFSQFYNQINDYTLHTIE